MGLERDIAGGSSTFSHRGKTATVSMSDQDRRPQPKRRNHEREARRTWDGTAHRLNSGAAQAGKDVCSGHPRGASAPSDEQLEKRHATPKDLGRHARVRATSAGIAPPANTMHEHTPCSGAASRRSDGLRRQSPARPITKTVGNGPVSGKGSARSRKCHAHTAPPGAARHGR